MKSGYTVVKRIIERITILINKVWNRKVLPDGWKEGIMSPIFKKGDRDNIRNYRGVTLLNITYKIYAMSFRGETESRDRTKKDFRREQASFRSGRRTIDNILILNYVVSSELQVKGRKLDAFLADLTSAFEKINREKLSRIIEKKEISKRLRTRLDEIYKEIRNKIRVKRLVVKG